MKKKNIFTLALISVLIFIGIASYLWYSYYVDYEERTLDTETDSDIKFLRGVELINSGAIDYINASVADEDEMIPVYYFRVRNSSNQDFNYVIYIENVAVNDGCTAETTFSRSELEYELTLEGVVIKKGGLDTIQNNVLDVNVIKANSLNDYSFRIRLKNDIKNYEGKHYHYTITMKEKK